ncbi:IS4/Tn5 family transposase DNA-binding protein [Nostoc sp. WHI]|nr:transposase [Nostoc sp. WHI]
MLDWWEKNFATCELGDRRLNERAMSITLFCHFGRTNR